MAREIFNRRKRGKIVEINNARHMCVHWRQDAKFTRQINRRLNNDKRNGENSKGKLSQMYFKEFVCLEHF